MKVFPPPKLQTRLNPHCFIGLFFLVYIFYGSDSNPRWSPSITKMNIENKFNTHFWNNGTI